MKKEEFIERYGEGAYDKRLAWGREYQKKYREKNHAKAIEHDRESYRKGGKYYDKALIDQRTGIRGKRNKIRWKHSRQWRRYKNVIAPESQIHHEWKKGTSGYNGVALVEKDQHQHGFIDVIEILEGKITFLTEEERR